MNKFESMLILRITSYSVVIYHCPEKTGKILMKCHLGFLLDEIDKQTRSDIKQIMKKNMDSILNNLLTSESSVAKTLLFPVESL